MHIALYSPAWPLIRYPNGVVTYVHWMREALTAQGHRVTVFATAMDPDWNEPGIHKIVGTPWLRCKRWLRNRVPAWRSSMVDWTEEVSSTLRSVHAKHPIDVIEMEESFGLFGELSKMLPIPVVVKLHGPAFLSLIEEELGTPAADAKIAAEGLALKHFKAVMSPSRDVLDRTVARYALSPPICEHVVNPLELPATAPVWDLATCDRRAILFVGRFDKRKGGDLVLLAFEKLLRTRPELKLVFIGPDFGVEAGAGPLVKFDEFKRRVFGDRPTPQIEYLGKRTAAEIAVQRGRAMVTVVASRWENQSYTALEAMLQGCPLVSTDCGGQGEFVKHGSTGLLARPDDADDLCEKIAALLDAPDQAAELGRNARAYVLAHHSPDVVASQTLAVYQRAIAASAGR
jgi:glycosyltransferase involved in cell wall biosynthesis